jgi:hypothetical protein
MVFHNAFSHRPNIACGRLGKYGVDLFVLCPFLGLVTAGVCDPEREYFHEICFVCAFSGTQEDAVNPATTDEKGLLRQAVYQGVRDDPP